MELSYVPTLVVTKTTPPELLLNSIARVFSTVPPPSDLHGSPEERCAAIEAVASSATHDINNPLACILVNLEELRASLPDVAWGVRELIDDSIDAAHRIRRSVRDLQGFLRHDDGRAVPVEVEHVLDRALRLIRNHLRDRATITKAYSPSPMVVSRDGRLRQLFIHLLLHVAHVIREADCRDTVIHVATGTGARGECEIAIVASAECTSEDADRSLVEALAVSLGGRIEESSSAAGYSWRVILPAAHPGGMSQTGSSARVARGKTPLCRVLVVDDDELLARALARGLAPHEVTVAVSAREAFELLLVDPGYDLVLCDVLMPRGSGIELYDQLRVLRPGAETTIVFMTAAAEESDALGRLHTLPNRVLYKPFEVRDVRRLLERELS
jgi:CheY-like chemotaxis protein